MSVEPGSLEVIADASSGEATRYAQALSLALITTLVLVLVFLVGSLIIVRSARRYRASLERRRDTPTQSDDVWSLAREDHNAEEADADEGQDGEQV